MSESSDRVQAGGDRWWNRLSEGVVLVEGGLVAGVNEAAARLLDVDATWVQGRSVIAVVRDHRVEEALAQGLPRTLQIRNKHVHVVPFNGGLLLKDVTEVRRAEENARELLAVLSHELRTPATSIRAVLDALNDDPSPELAARFLPRAIAEADRLSRLLEDLTVEVKPPETRRIAITEVVTRALSLLQPLLEQREVQVVQSVPEAVVMADADKLLQVLVNLLENAAIHGPAHAQVELAAWAEGSRLRVEVRDQGTPLDPASVEQLFQPHSRGRGTGSAKGTGLGLYIVRSIASRWGGESWGGPRTDAEPGNSFGVSVPLA